MFFFEKKQKNTKPADAWDGELCCNRRKEEDNSGCNEKNRHNGQICDRFRKDKIKTFAWKVCQTGLVSSIDCFEQPNLVDHQKKLGRRQPRIVCVLVCFNLLPSVFTFSPVFFLSCVPTPSQAELIRGIAIALIGTNKFKLGEIDFASLAAV